MRGEQLGLLMVITKDYRSRSNNNNRNKEDNEFLLLSFVTSASGASHFNKRNHFLSFSPSVSLVWPCFRSTTYRSSRTTTVVTI